MNTKAPDILSVSTYLDKLNVALKGERSKIVGEICNLQMYDGRSYLYFSLQDSKDRSTVKCFMWKRDFQISGVQLKEGMEVVITAYPNVYKPNGGLTMQVELVELIGEGALKLAYDELKKKLEAEGLLAESRKRQLPDYPVKIGVITSRSGAVIHDFLTNIGKFGFEILFVDSKVEGQDATKDLLHALEVLKKKDIDVLVMMRGGGSLESFQAFNNELLVRAVAEFPVPVLTGIGHDKDVPLVSLVSDRNVSTPTAVAALLNSTWNLARSSVELAEEKIMSQYQARLRHIHYEIEQSHVSIERRFAGFLEAFHKAEASLGSALHRIDAQITRLGDLIQQHTKDMHKGFEALMQRVQESLKQSSRTIELSSPERQLAHGYSIVRHGTKVVRRVDDVAAGEELDIMVSDGTIRSKTI